MNYVSIEDVRKLLNLQESETNDRMIQDMIDEASAIAEPWKGSCKYDKKISEVFQRIRMRRRSK